MTPENRPAARPGPTPGSFESAARQRRGLLREYWEFLRFHRKWYLIPVVAALVVLGILVFAAGSSVAPFIYTMF